MNIKKYKTIIFDCDGVILNSNQIKTDSFRETLENFDTNLVDEFILFHKENGGISRYAKIKYFLNVLVPKYENSSNLENETYEELIKKYGLICKKSLMEVEITCGLNLFRNHTANAKWLLVSGGDEVELKELFNIKKINHYFNGGIFGSPDTKNEIIKREQFNKNIQNPTLFIGDSKLDYFAAKSNSLDFVFLTEWTDFKKYKEFCKENNIIFKKDIKSLIDC
tara:strand:+ start:10 stop:678 length:669 start_codon:yes stop_codon:yes gene_type:complete